MPTVGGQTSSAAPTSSPLSGDDLGAFRGDGDRLHRPIKAGVQPNLLMVDEVGHRECAASFSSYAFDQAGNSFNLAGGKIDPSPFSEMQNQLEARRLHAENLFELLKAGNPIVPKT